MKKLHVFWQAIRHELFHCSNVVFVCQFLSSWFVETLMEPGIYHRSVRQLSIELSEFVSLQEQIIRHTVDQPRLAPSSVLLYSKDHIILVCIITGVQFSQF